jgi:PiT family inorganic phosphate transporter
LCSSTPSRRTVANLAGLLQRLEVPPRVLVLRGVAVAFAGLQDLPAAAHALAAVVSTRVLTPRRAVSRAAPCNILAVCVFGMTVTPTIGHGIMPLAVTDNGMILAA